MAAWLPLLALVLGMLLLPPMGALIAGQPLGELFTFPLDARTWDPLPPDTTVLILA